MLDIQLLRSNLEAIIAGLDKRGFNFDRVRFLTLEETRKTLQTETQQAQAQRNTLSKQIGILKGKGEDTSAVMQEVAGLGDQLKDNECQLAALLEQIEQLLASVPNVPDSSVPVGRDETGNVEVSRWGEPRQFDFPVLDHVDLGVRLGLDFESAAKLSGSRFAILSGGLARLHRALAQFMLDTHRDQHGYEEVIVPLLVNPATMFGTGQLPKFEADLFRVPRDEGQQYLIPTAEVPLTNLVRDRLLTEQELPLKFTSHSACFRSEAGSYGRDTRGMIRQHQFEKVEMVRIERPEDSDAALEEMTGHAETILRKLELPYRKLLLCTGDMGFSARKTYDLEVWLPAQNTYREISSCSNTGDFQARRMQARLKSATGKNLYLHTLNGSGLAVGRTLVAVLENYQNKDGSITVPKVLEAYLGGMTVLAPR